MKNALVLVLPVLTASAAAAQCESQSLLAADGAAGDEFGYTVALEGSRAAVGAPLADNPQVDSGSVYVFERTATWLQTAELAAIEAQAGDQFGFSVATSGDRIVVGAPCADGAFPETGAAYVFENQGGVWVQTDRLTANAPISRGRFGWIVDIEGDTAVVGMHVEDPPFPQVPGTAYVFEKMPGGWQQVATLDPSDGVNGNHFAYSLSLSGSRILIGARGKFSGAFEGGSAYVFENTGPGWVESAQFSPAGIGEGNWFGESVVLQGTRALIGASAGFVAPGPGAAYVYDLVGPTWTETAKLTADNPVIGDRFGKWVALDGDDAVIGASRTSDLGSLPGSIYSFKFNGVSWTQQEEIKASDASLSDSFGQAVAFDGKTVVAGAPMTFSPLAFGSAYTFLLDRQSTPVLPLEIVRLGSPPNPAALLPGLSNGPIINATWDPVIDHTNPAPTVPFMPNAVLDILAFSAPGSVNLPSIYGTILCWPVFIQLLSGPQVPFAIHISNDCSLLGVSLCVQGASWNGSFPLDGAAVQVTNALDITIGN